VGASPAVIAPPNGLSLTMSSLERKGRKKRGNIISGEEKSKKKGASLGACGARERGRSEAMSKKEGGGGRALLAGAPHKERGRSSPSPSSVSIRP